MGIGILIGIALTAALIAVYQSWRFKAERQAEHDWFEQEQQFWHALRDQE